MILPKACVITNVDYDHMDLLGDTLEQIAFEKAGIIKPKVPVVVGAMGDGPRAVILSRAAELDAPVFLLGHAYEAREFARTGYRGNCTLRVDWTVWRNVTLNCPAAFMATNVAWVRQSWIGSGAVRYRSKPKVHTTVSEGQSSTVFMTVRRENA